MAGGVFNCGGYPRRGEYGLKDPYVYLDIEDSIIMQETDSKGYVPKLGVEVEYLQKGDASIIFDYNWNGDHFEGKAEFPIKGDGEWRILNAELRGLFFPSVELSIPEKDLRLSSTKPEGFYISKVILRFRQRKN